MTSGNGFHIKTDMCTDIAVITLFPGMNYNIFDYLNLSCRGVIIEGFGIGGMPDNIIEHIHRLTTNGICVVITTQCLYEGVNWEIYEVGRNLAKENVINGKSMTIENLTMKLMWSLAHYKNITDVKNFMERSYNNMLTEQRHEIILNLLSEKGSITVTELKDILNTSESTIRRDLNTLDEQGRLTKVFGGAVEKINGVSTTELSVSQKADVNTEEKKKLQCTLQDL